jgi:NADPH2:quinone reductase
MKAVRFAEFGGAEVLKTAEVERPRAQGDEVLIQTIAAAISYVDVRTRQGAYNRAETRVGGVKLPSIPGLQGVGRVVEVGPKADQSLMGRKVVAAVKEGAYAEYFVASSALCAVAPDDADDAVLAAIPMQGLTAYFMLTASTALKKGESILVHAAGSGVGSLAVQIAKIIGAGKIIATAATQQKRDYARRVGADVTVDYDSDGWTRKVMEATEGRGVDVLLESIGGDVFEQNFECLATFGRYIIFGSTRGVAKPVEARRLMTKSQSLTGIYMPVFHSRPDLMKQGLRFLVDNVAKGALHLQIAEQLSLSDAAKAHQMLEDRKVIGAIVLRP